MMPEYLREYLEGIDACMFSGCDFDDPANRAILREYMARWEREMARTDASQSALHGCHGCGEKVVPKMVRGALICPVCFGEDLDLI